jgi:hypothetical protein
MTLTENQIKHMVDRFLSWKLPGNFNPDGGIIFKKTFNEHTAHPMKYEPSGTNLFDATQVDGMVRHMVEEMPLKPDFRWLIEAPGARYLAVQRGTDFEWTVDQNKALAFRSKEQADALMMAVRQMDREMDPHRRGSFVALFGFEGSLGNARAVEHDCM